MRKITFAEAIFEATVLAMERDPNVFIIGEGVPDPKGIFGTTLGLRERFGRKRVMDMPLAENGITGVCIGAALNGLRPILTHQRIDFSLLSFDQIANVAAKWYYMFNGLKRVPITIRMIIGRGWGQGAQHSQSLQALYAHIPGLKVIMPSTPADAKGLFLASIFDDNPVIFIEHRWLHNYSDVVRDGFITEQLGKGKLLRRGKDVTVIASSYMTIEALKAHETASQYGISADVIDLRSVKPLDEEIILNSVHKTGRLLVCDTGYETLGVASEIVSRVSRKGFSSLRSAPEMVTLPDFPTPTSKSLAERFYPTHLTILKKLLSLTLKNSQISKIITQEEAKITVPSDIPDMSFRGPF